MRFESERNWFFFFLSSPWLIIIIRKLTLLFSYHLCHYIWAQSVAIKVEDLEQEKKKKNFDCVKTLYLIIYLSCQINNLQFFLYFIFRTSKIWSNYLLLLKIVFLVALINGFFLTKCFIFQAVIIVWRSRNYKLQDHKWQKDVYDLCTFVFNEMKQIC